MSNRVRDGISGGFAVLWFVACAAVWDWQPGFELSTAGVGFAAWLIFSPFAANAIDAWWDARKARKAAGK